MNIHDAYITARAALLAESADGHWTGELAASAISTATTISAWVLLLRSGKLRDETLSAECREAAPRAKDYLLRTQNPDGGWGDTDRSHSNIAATMLATAALKLYAEFFSEDTSASLQKSEEYIRKAGGVAGIRRRYGADKTFAVPILTNAALAGMVSWREVSPLPFEFACIPHRFLGLMRLPVVSYAIPALVAIGQAVFYHRKSWNPLTKLRHFCVSKSLRVLREKQPGSGGFLEAAPLTAFVLMSLASIPRKRAIPEEEAVMAAAARFLLNSMRADGSVPIDTNLATWVTSLSVSALSHDAEALSKVNHEWILSCQHRTIHPFTQTPPGGWGWTDLSGAVPDADDTPGALLALYTLMMMQLSPDGRLRAKELAFYVKKTGDAAKGGIHWLLDLQNSDDGFPTFCRGWGALPFDRSGTDLTAHALRAFYRWIPFLKFSASDVGPEGRLGWGCVQNDYDHPSLRAPLRKGIDAQMINRMEHAINRGLQYLEKTQRPDGSWIPLWFGDQDHPEEENPVYGTTRVLLAWWELGRADADAARRGLEWLKNAQNADGTWGTPGKMHIEQTALATEIMLLFGETSHAEKGLRRLTEWVESGEFRHAAPIGFYFAKLWYYERLYPIIFTTRTLAAALYKSGE